jgi:hypothetical protein
MTQELVAQPTYHEEEIIIAVPNTWQRIQRSLGKAGERWIHINVIEYNLNRQNTKDVVNAIEMWLHPKSPIAASRFITRETVLRKKFCRVEKKHVGYVEAWCSYDVYRVRASFISYLVSVTPSILDAIHKNNLRECERESRARFRSYYQVSHLMTIEEYRAQYDVAGEAQKKTLTAKEYHDRVIQRLQELSSNVGKNEQTFEEYLTSEAQRLWDLCDRNKDHPSDTVLLSKTP